MYPVSPEFIKEIVSGATIVTRADVYRGEDEPVLSDIPILPGSSISEDPYADVRRRCSLSVAPSEGVIRYTPSAVFKDDNGMWPAGSEIRIRQGVRFADTSLGTEWVEMGWFSVGRVEVRRTNNDMSLSIDGFDLSRRIGRSRLTDAFNIIEGSKITDVIFNLFLSQCQWLDGAKFMFDEVRLLAETAGVATLTTPHIVLDINENPWTFAVSLCRDQGIDLRIDGDKNIVMRAFPNVNSDDPVASYKTGEFNIIEEYSRVLDDDNSYNGVIVIGENPSNDSVVRGEVWDVNINSPTYFDPANPGNSVYGPHPLIITNQNIASVDAAAWSAYYTFLNNRGIMETVSVRALPHFAHEPFDLVFLHDPESGVDGHYMFQTCNIGLGPDGSLTATTVGKTWFQ
jgi:hypothetical protein